MPFRIPTQGVFPPTHIPNNMCSNFLKSLLALLIFLAIAFCLLLAWFYSSLSNGCELIVNCCFDLHLQWVVMLSVLLCWLFQYLILDKYLYKSFAHFKNKLFGFSVVIVRCRIILLTTNSKFRGFFLCFPHITPLSYSIPHCYWESPCLSNCHSSGSLFIVFFSL